MTPDDEDDEISSPTKKVKPAMNDEQANDAIKGRAEKKKNTLVKIEKNDQNVNLSDIFGEFVHGKYDAEDQNLGI